MRTVNAKCGAVIPVGRLGENEATAVVFDVAEYEQLFGAGTFSLLHQRSGDALPYPCIVEYSGSKVTWIVRSADVAVQGYGKCELIYTVGGTIAKSVVFTTITGTALTGGTEPPEPWEDWVENVLEAGVAALVSAESASDSATAAAASAEAAQQAAETAAHDAAAETAELVREEMQGYVSDAQDAKNAAQSAQTGAETAKAAAESAKEAAGASESAAAASATSAAGSAANAATSAQAASTAQGAAEDAQEAAETAETNAQNYATTATNMASAAAGSAQNAATSEGNAYTYQQGAKEHRDETEEMLDDLVKYDNDEFASPLPFNADRLNGHPDSYFAKQEDMSAAEEGIAENRSGILSLRSVAERLGLTKVDKETGKGLSTNDYSNEEKQKVADNTAARHTHANKSILDSITQAMLDLIGTITGKYVKPDGGIPKTDLASDVQTSLGKADSALQQHQSLADYRTATAQDTLDAQKYSETNPPPYPVTSVNGQTGGVVLNYITFDEEES